MEREERLFMYLRSPRSPRTSRTPRSSRSLMRIVGGQFGGRRLVVPKDSRVRPTADRVREAWMSIVGQAVIDARVLDLFAGSGALGLEALSRGAAHATFVEKDRRAAAAIEALAREWQEVDAAVVCTDAIGWLAGSVPAAP